MPRALARYGKWVQLVCTATFAMTVLLFMKSLVCPFRGPSQRSRYQETESTKYLTYLPHSGLSNQRIQLANAIILASLLNRTLIVPPALLGFVKDEVATQPLQTYLAAVTSRKEVHCSDRVLGRIQTYMKKGRCAAYDQVAVVPWTDLHPFTGLPKSVKIEHVDTVSMGKICGRYQLDCEKDVHTYHTERAFEWQVYENKSEALEVVKKQENFMVTMMQGNISYAVWSLDYLRRPERLLHFGEIFGSHRISLLDDHAWLRQQVAASLVYRLDTLFGRVARDIVDFLGGAGSFLSLHIRTGDTQFENALENNLEKLSDTLTQSPHYIPAQVGKKSARLRPFTECGPHRSGRIIYVATNLGHPRHPSSPLLPFFKRFPCSVTLDDIPKRLFAPLEKSKGDLLDSQKELLPFWIPLVDAIVAAHAVEFHGTPRSTFSSFISQLNHQWIQDYPERLSAV